MKLMYDLELYEVLWADHTKIWLNALRKFLQRTDVEAILGVSKGKNRKKVVDSINACFYHANNLKLLVDTFMRCAQKWSPEMNEKRVFKLINGYFRNSLNRDARTFFLTKGIRQGSLKIDLDNLVCGCVYCVENPRFGEFLVSNSTKDSRKLLENLSLFKKTNEDLSAAWEKLYPGSISESSDSDSELSVDSNVPAFDDNEMQLSVDSNVPAFDDNEMQLSVDSNVPAFAVEDEMQLSVDSNVPAFAVEDEMQLSVDSNVPAFDDNEMQLSVDSNVPAFAVEDEMQLSVDSNVPAFAVEDEMQLSVDSNVPAFAVEDEIIGTIKVIALADGNQATIDSSYAGVQCCAMAVAAIVQAQVLSPEQWQTETINNVLTEGDRLYMRVRDHAVGLSERGLLGNGYLEMNHFNCVRNGLDLYGERFTLEFDNDSAIFGLLSENGEFGLVLRDGLERLFQQHEAGVLTMNSYCFAVIKSGNKLYFVDSHACVFGGGKACIVECDTIDSLIFVIEQVFGDRIQANTEYSIDFLIVNKKASEEDFDDESYVLAENLSHLQQAATASAVIDLNGCMNIDTLLDYIDSGNDTNSEFEQLLSGNSEEVVEFFSVDEMVVEDPVGVVVCQNEITTRRSFCFTGGMLTETTRINPLMSNFVYANGSVRHAFVHLIAKGDNDASSAAGVHRERMIYAVNAHLRELSENGIEVWALLGDMGENLKSHEVDPIGEDQSYITFVDCIAHIYNRFVKWLSPRTGKRFWYRRSNQTGAINPGIRVEVNVYQVYQDCVNGIIFDRGTENYNLSVDMWVHLDVSDTDNSNFGKLRQYNSGYFRSLLREFVLVQRNSLRYSHLLIVVEALAKLQDVYFLLDEELTDDNCVIMMRAVNFFKRVEFFSVNNRDIVYNSQLSAQYVDSLKFMVDKFKQNRIRVVPIAVYSVLPQYLVRNKCRADNSMILTKAQDYVCFLETESKHNRNTYYSKLEYTLTPIRNFFPVPVEYFVRSPVFRPISNGVDNAGLIPGINRRDFDANDLELALIAMRRAIDGRRSIFIASSNAVVELLRILINRI